MALLSKRKSGSVTDMREVSPCDSLECKTGVPGKYRQLDSITRASIRETQYPITRITSP